MAEIALVSVIIPCYNAERWISEAIDSCLTVSYPRVEIIIVNDGSTDRSLDVIKRYRGAVRWVSGPNRGGCAARNTGFVLSHGEYIQFLDADDYVLREKVERQVAFLEATGADAVYGDWRYQYHSADGATSLGEIWVPGERDDAVELPLTGPFVACHALLYKREIVLKVGGWDEGLPGAQDQDFLLRVALTGADIRYQPGCFSIYRHYGNATVSTSGSRRYIESRYRVLDKAEKALADAGRLSTRYRQLLAKEYFGHARWYYDRDRTEYRRLLHKALSLDPELQPDQSRAYNLARRVFGFEIAEQLGSYKRRTLGLMRSRGTM